MLERPRPDLAPTSPRARVSLPSCDLAPTSPPPTEGRGAVAGRNDLAPQVAPRVIRGRSVAEVEDALPDGSPLRADAILADLEAHGLAVTFGNRWTRGRCAHLLAVGLVTAPGRAA
jgi:hypothetical protein